MSFRLKKPVAVFAGLFFAATCQSYEQTTYSFAWSGGSATVDITGRGTGPYPMGLPYEPGRFVANIACIGGRPIAQNIGYGVAHSDIGIEGAFWVAGIRAEDVDEVDYAIQSQTIRDMGRFLNGAAWFATSPRNEWIPYYDGTPQYYSYLGSMPQSLNLELPLTMSRHESSTLNNIGGAIYVGHGILAGMMGEALGKASRLAESQVNAAAVYDARTGKNTKSQAEQRASSTGVQTSTAKLNSIGQNLVDNNKVVKIRRIPWVNCNRKIDPLGLYPDPVTQDDPTGFAYRDPYRLDFMGAQKGGVVTEVTPRPVNQNQYDSAGSN